MRWPLKIRERPEKSSWVITSAADPRVIQFGLKLVF
jgi:hypothetical protein